MTRKEEDLPDLTPAEAVRRLNIGLEEGVVGLLAYAGEIAALRSLLAEVEEARRVVHQLVDRDVSYVGHLIHIPVESHADAIRIVREARAFLERTHDQTD